MSHVDEGTLHAYLDGALDALPAAEAARVREHLAVCEICAGRLEEERALRDEAAAILAGAGPEAVEPPPLEELRASARARTRTSRPRTRAWRLGWAASVVLAIGAGWMLRAAAGPDVAVDDSNREAARSVAPSDAAGATGGVAAPTGVVAATSPANVADRDAEAAPSSPDRAVPTEERADRLAGVPAGDTGSVRTASASLEEPTADVGTLAGVAPPAAVLPEPSRIADEVTGEITTLGTRLDTLAFPRTAAEAKEAVAAAPRPVEEPLARAAAADRVVPPAPVSAEQELGRAREKALPAAQRALRQVPVTGDNAASGSASLVVPGLQVLSVTGLDGEGLVGAVRVRQLLVDGDTLELTHLPPGMAPSVLPPVPDDARTELVLPRDGGLLVVRAHASPDDLLALLRRMDEGG